LSILGEKYNEEREVTKVICSPTFPLWTRCFFLFFFFSLSLSRLLTQIKITRQQNKKNITLWSRLW